MATAREMSNLLLLWDDAVTEISGVTIEGHSTETSGFVAENLLDTSRQTCFKVNAAGDDINVGFDLGAAYTIKGIGLLNHNADNRGVSNMIVKYGAATLGASSTLATFDVATKIGDDDFVFMFNAGVSSRYWWLEFDSVDGAGLYMGRIFLAREAYDYTGAVLSPMPKGYLHVEDILETKGGVEHGISRGSLRKRMMPVIPPVAADAARAEIISLIEHVELNHKKFVTSWPYGTTQYAGANRYGLGVHARFNLSEWQYQCITNAKSQLPLDMVEVL